ncbi:hypothetical protein BGZ46_004176 [Entomortierella lignicola]|nr:hypothetical protein BGZ46_004176 [Entomortierella lignicola]
MATDPNASYFAFFDTPTALSSYSQQQTSLEHSTEPINPPLSYPRRSMSPIGGAATAMKNFLRRRRGTLSGSPTNNIPPNINTDVSANRHSSGDIASSTKRESNIYKLPPPQPSMSHPQSFVFVGGYGVEPGTTVVLSDSDLPESSPTSPIIPPMTLPQYPQYQPAVVTTAATTLSQQTFSQVMTSHFNDKEEIELPPTPTNNDKRNHSRHASVSGGLTLANNLASSSLSSLSSVSSTSSSPASSMFSTDTANRKDQERRSLSSEGPAQSFDLAAQEVQKEISLPITGGDNVDNSVAPLEVVNSVDNEQRGEMGDKAEYESDEDEVDNNWSDRKMISKKLSLAFNVGSLPDTSLKIPSNISPDETRYEKFQRQRRQEQSNVAQDALQKQQQIRQQLEEERKNQLYQNSANFLKERLNDPCYAIGYDISNKKAISFDKGYNNKNINDRIYTSKRIGDSLGKSNPNNFSQKQRRRQSESGMLNKKDRQVDIHDTAAALEDLEKEIVVLKSKEIIVPNAEQQRSNNGDNILLVSKCSSPTQFYDSQQTRYALRSFLTGNSRDFEEMIEYGFPSDIFPDSATTVERTATPSDPLPEMACRYVTLRITLTPWHARADEAKLYGSASSDSDKPIQLKTMVNKFFSRTPAAAATATTTASTAQTSSNPPPPSQRARMMAGARRPSEQSITTRSNRSSAESASTPLPESGPGQAGSRKPNEEKEGGLSHRSSDSEDHPPPESRASSRAQHIENLKRDNNLKMSLRHMDSLEQARPSPRLPVGSAIGNSTRQVLSAPSTRTPSPMPSINNLHGLIQQSQPPRKGSLSALSVPIKDNQDNGAQKSRKSSSPAIIYAPSIGSCVNQRGVTTNNDFNFASSVESLNAIHSQEQRRSTRYPYQQHVVYQDQQQQSRAMPNSNRTPWTSIPSQAPHPLATSISPDSTEQIYDYYQAAPPQEKLAGAAPQLQQIPERVINSSSQDKVDNTGNVAQVTTAVQPPAIPPRINAKSWKRRGTRTDDSIAPSEAAIIAAAAAAAASDDQMFSDGKYEYHDTNHEQNSDAYFETSMDNYSYGGHGYGRDNYHDRQAKPAAISSGGCWRPVQCHQTESMTTFAFP